MDNRVKFYSWLIGLLVRKHLTFEEIANEWRDANANQDEDELDKRTFHRYRENIQSQFGITVECIIRKTKCFRPAKRNVQKAKRNVFVLDTLPNHIKIALERLSCQILTLFLSTYQCLSYHNLKALHISELQAAIFRCLEQLLLVNCLDGYLYLLVGKFLEILLGLLLLIEEVLIDLSELG